jgi:hypothetical protein
LPSLTCLSRLSRLSASNRTATTLLYDSLAKTNSRFTNIPLPLLPTAPPCILNCISLCIVALHVSCITKRTPFNYRAFGTTSTTCL